MGTSIRDLPGKTIDLSMAAVYGGIGIGVIQASPLPGPIKTGAGGLIGLKLIKGAKELLD